MRLTIATRRVTKAALIALVCSACDDVPKGPDQQPLPGAPGGAAIPSPRVTSATPSGGDLAACDAAKRDMDAHPNDQTGTVGGVTWRRLDGAWECDVPGPPRRTHRFKPLSGEVDEMTLTNAAQVYAPSGLTLFGKTGTFRAKVANCTDAIWVQYIRVEYKFYNAAGAEVATKTDGPRIDVGIPYPFQQGAGGEAQMQDDAGARATGGATAQQVVSAAINRYKAEAGVNDATITKAVLKYDFWSYLLCLAPTYRVIGHVEWGFTQTIDQNTAPYISKSDEREPAWTAGR